MNHVRFKSLPENWIKEKTVKRNTVRKRDYDYRFDLLDNFKNSYRTPLRIIIENSKTGKTFKRTVTDVTKWEGLYIISWQ